MFVRDKVPLEELKKFSLKLKKILDEEAKKYDADEILFSLEMGVGLLMPSICCIIEGDNTQKRLEVIEELLGEIKTSILSSLRFHDDLMKDTKDKNNTH